MKNIRTLMIVFPLLSCASTQANFARDMAVCEVAPTCAEAVTCRLDVAERYRRDPEKTVGRCEPNDGGVAR